MGKWLRRLVSRPGLRQSVLMQSPSEFPRGRRSGLGRDQIPLEQTRMHRHTPPALGEKQLAS